MGHSTFVGFGNRRQCEATVRSVSGEQYLRLTLPSGEGAPVPPDRLADVLWESIQNAVPVGHGERQEFLRSLFARLTQRSEVDLVPGVAAPIWDADWDLGERPGEDATRAYLAMVRQYPAPSAVKLDADDEGSIP